VILTTGDERKGLISLINPRIRELEQQLENARLRLGEQEKLVERSQSLLLEKEAELKQVYAELAGLKSEHTELTTLSKRKRDMAEDLRKGMETLVSMDYLVEDKAVPGLSVKNSREDEDEDGQGRESAAKRARTSSPGSLEEDIYD
jgi:chromosome segregation ATPase